MKEESIMNDLMQQALLLAEKGRYTAMPNPMVGCVIERDGEIIGSGWHESPGNPHAEIIALNSAGEKAKGANVYVTLEPCSHYGRTPPCVDALIKAEVNSVHIPFVDPNPLVNGKGIAKLKFAGIKVYVGEEEAEARRLNEVFLHYITTKKPFVIAKWAMTLDGNIATDNGHSRWISGIESRGHAHQIRREVAAILVGSKTVALDNPELTVRLTNEEIYRQPVRIVLDSNGNVPFESKVLNKNLSNKTLIATTKKSSHKWRDQMANKRTDVWILKEDDFGKVDIGNLLEKLGAHEITSLLVEGGSSVLTSFFSRQLVNKIYVYMAPKLVGGKKNNGVLQDLGITNMTSALQLDYDAYEKLGNDILVTAYPRW